MNKSPLRSAFFAAIMIVSASCFVYVNAHSTSETANAVKTLTVQTTPVKDTKMPDLKLVKSVMDFIGKFVTAK